MIQSSKSLTIEQWVSTEKYRNNYDAIFGKKPTVLSWKEDSKEGGEAKESIATEPEASSDPSN